MRTIYKYSLESGCDRVSLLLPKGAEILSVQYQMGKLMMWCMVDPSEETVTRKFYIAATGQRLPDHSMKFLATVQQGILVWHILEILNQ